MDKSYTTGADLAIEITGFVTFTLFTVKFLTNFHTTLFSSFVGLFDDSRRRGRYP